MTYTPADEPLLPIERKIRVTEDPPGNTFVTTRPCYAVAYIQDDGQIGVATSTAGNNRAILSLAAATLSHYADRAGLTLEEAAANAVTGLRRVGGLKVRSR